jgi:hypothetical protein
VFARVGESKGRDGITSFVVDKSKPGISLSKIPVIRSYSPYEVHFNDYEVPIEDRLGEEGKGFSFAEEWLVHARPPYAAATIGIAQAALDIAIDHRAGIELAEQGKFAVRRQMHASVFNTRYLHFRTVHKWYNSSESAGKTGFVTIRSIGLNGCFQRPFVAGGLARPRALPAAFRGIVRPCRYAKN